MIDINILNKRGLVYAANTTMAALAAIWIACSWNLLNPGWAALTVFICSQPMSGISGAVSARAIHRLAGTLAGCAAGLLIIPAFADVPELLVAAIALWVGTCVYLSLIEKGPRSYAFLLAGYSVGLVALPQAGVPGNLFDILLARSETVAVGAGCAAVAHALFLPATAGDIATRKVAAVVEQARRAIVDALNADALREDGHASGVRIGQALGELRQLVATVEFDLARAYDGAGLLQAIEERMVAIAVILPAVASRLPALEALAGSWQPLASFPARVAAWIANDAGAGPAALDRLGQLTSSLLPAPGVLPVHDEALVANGVQRANELARTWHALMLLANALQAREPLPAWAGRTQTRKLHVDHGMALFAGASVALTVIVAASLVLLTGWQQGAAAVGLAMTGTSVFAAFDDPRPAIRVFLKSAFLAIPVSAAYVFGILPVVGDLSVLMLVLAPLYFITALFVASPTYGLIGYGFALTSQTFIALQVAASSDLIAFSNLAIGSVAGTVIGLVVTSLVRVVAPATSARRILALAHDDLHGLVGGWRDTRDGWASRMLDRAALLVPRLGGASDHQHVRSVFSDLRLGVNVLELREIVRSMQAEALPAVDHALRAVSGHIVSRGHRVADGVHEAVVRTVDGAIDVVAAMDPGPLRTRALAAASGLRSSLLEGIAPRSGEAA